MAQSRESRALSKSAPKFRAGVDPCWIITKLYENLFMTQSEWNKAKQKTLTEDERLDAVWETLVRRVAVDPSIFHSVVEILRNEPALEKLGDHMKGSLSDGEEDHDASSPETAITGHRAAYLEEGGGRAAKGDNTPDAPAAYREERGGRAGKPENSFDAPVLIYSGRNMPNSRSPELDAITVYTELIYRAIINVAGISWFTEKLLASHLITAHISNEILSTGGYSPEEQCQRLMNAVKVQVEASPSVFSKFLQIFKSEVALQILADTIENAVKYSEDLEKMQRHKGSLLRPVFRSPTNSLVSIPDSEEHSSLPQNIAFAFAVLLADLTGLLEQHEGALDKMNLTFQFIATIMKSKAYYTVLQSKHYKSIKSVRDFFLHLTNFWKPVDCSLLITLVEATHCNPAIERLQSFLSRRDVEEEMTKLMQQSQVPTVASEASIPPSTVTTSPPMNDAPTQLEEETNLPSSLCSADQVEPPPSNSEKNEEESKVISTQLQSHQSDSLSVHATVDQNSLTLAEYEHKTNILCGALKIPRCFLRLVGMDPGSVIIKWVTSKGILPYLKSRVIRDADILLLLKENITSIQIGTEYCVQIGSAEFWTKEKDVPKAADSFPEYARDTSPERIVQLKTTDFVPDNAESTSRDEEYARQLPGQLDAEYTQEQNEDKVVPKATDSDSGYPKSISLQDVHKFRKFDKKEETPLMDAAKNGRTDEVKILIEQGADVNAKDKRQSTVLHHACRAGHLPVVQALLDRGANMNAQNWWGGTPLMWASRHGRTDVVEELIKRGGDVNAQDHYQYTALHRSSVGGHLPVVKVLLDRGANVRAQDDYGNTPLMWAARHGRTDVVEELISRGGDVNAQDKEQFTALHHASANGHLPVVKGLLDRGANVRAQNLGGKTPLMEAARHGRTDEVEELISRGGDVNAHDKNGLTAMMIAILEVKQKESREKIVQLLIDGEANVNAQNQDGLTAMMIAILEVEEKESCEKIVQLLIDGEANVNAQNQKGLTALLIAIKKGMASLVQILLQVDQIEVNISDTSVGWSALFYAVSGKNLEITRMLIAAEANVLLKDKNQMTVLNIARLYHDKEIIEELTHQMTKQVTTQEPAASQEQSPAHEDVTISQARMNMAKQSKEKVAKVFRILEQRLKSTRGKKKFYKLQAAGEGEEIVSLSSEH